MARKKKTAAADDRILHGREALLAQEESQKKKKKERLPKQIWNAYKMAKKSDPAVTWWVLGVMISILAIFILLGIFGGMGFFAYIMAPFMALLGGLFILTRRAERAAYAQIEGRPGATRAAIGTIRRGWTFPEEPSAIDPRTQDMVWRGVGRGGVVLVSEGPAPRVNRLIEAERKRVARVLPDTVPVSVVQAGRGEGQVPLPKLAKAIKKHKKKLTKPETAEVLHRLTAIRSSRPPIPKGIDPSRARPDRKAMRGR